MNASIVYLRSALVGAVLVIVCATTAIAQTYQGALRGAVRDMQGLIPGAEVTLINEDTNASRSAMTNEVGEYAFTSILPGSYTVRVALPGFKTSERTGFRIGTQQSLVLDFTLEVGGISEQIMMCWLTQTQPNSSALVMRIARPTSRVQTDADSP